MNNIKRLVLIVFFAGAVCCLQSCFEDDPGPTEVLLTLNIDPDYFLEGYDAWIFISDQNGNTIDVRQATDSTHIKFLGSPQSTLTLSIFTRVAFPDGADGSLWNSFGFNSYQGIAPGSTLDIKKGIAVNNEPIPDPIGTASFTLEDYDDSNNPEESLVISDSISMPYTVLDYSSFTYTGTNFSSQLFLRENPSRILVTTYRDNLPVHLWLNQVVPDEAVVVSFDSFVPSNTIAINKQVAHGEVKIMKGESFATGYNFCNLYSRQISNSSNLDELPKLGYLEGFEKYFVHVVMNPFHDRTNIFYTKAGTIPTSVDLPVYTYSVINDNLYGLSLQFSNTHDFKEAFFTSSNAETQVNWTLNASAEENFKAPSIPSEIETLYPMLSVEGLKLNFAAYTHRLDGYTYAQYVNDNLGSVRKEVFEELRYVIKS